MQRQEVTQAHGGDVVDDNCRFSLRLDPQTILLFSRTYDSNECWSSRLQEAQNETKLSRQARALEIDIY